jgi:hypothetical protein
MTNSLTTNVPDTPEDYSDVVQGVFLCVFCGMICCLLAETGDCDQIGEPEGILVVVGMLFGSLLFCLVMVGAVVISTEIVAWFRNSANNLEP